MPRPALSAESIDCRVQDDVGIVTITNPGVCNALTLPMWRQLAEVVQRLGRDPGVGVILLRGAGADFSSGADITQLPPDPAVFDRVHVATEQAIASTPKPVLAAISGYCVGGGCEIAVAADFRFADPTARFGITAGRLGIVYPAVPTLRLVELIGVGHARRLLYAGELLDAEWALRAGLVTEVCDAPQERALAFARLLTSRSRATIRAAKQIIAAALERRAGAYTPDGSLTDYREGVAAFRERRPPRFPSTAPPPDPAAP